MPELPDIVVYIEALEERIVGEPLERIRLHSPFLLRTFAPPSESLHGRRVRQLQRIGKRIAIGLEDDLWIVLHLMIAGRLHWKPAGARLAGAVVTNPHRELAKIGSEPITGDQPWTLASVEFTAPPESGRVSMEIEIEADAGTLWADEAAVYEIR